MTDARQQDLPILELRNIHKAFYHPRQVQILKGVNLTIQRGDSLAIIGRSGEGKSTFLHLLGSLEPACQGMLLFQGTEINTFNRSAIRNKNIGFVFQSFHLMEDYTSLENVLMPAKIARKPTKKGSEAYERGMSLLEAVGLADRAAFHTKLLSGGEKQRIAIARAMCNDPDILLADEPSGNLDGTTSQHIHELLLRFTHDYGKTLIVVTHNTDLANLCQRRYELKDGLLS